MTNQNQNPSTTDLLTAQLLEGRYENATFHAAQGGQSGGANGGTSPTGTEATSEEVEERAYEKVRARIREKYSVDIGGNSNVNASSSSSSSTGGAGLTANTKRVAAANYCSRWPRGLICFPEIVRGPTRQVESSTA